MMGVRLLRVALSGATVLILAGCTNVTVVDDFLSAGGTPTTEFTADDGSVTLTARFESAIGKDQSFMVEWLFPDGSVYLRKPVRRSGGDAERLETSMPIRGKAPARHPGLWHVSLSHDGERLVDRSFEIREPLAEMNSGAADFAALAHCGPSRWHDPVISARRTKAVRPGRPGAWIGGEVLRAAGATYSGVILLTGCAPG